MRKICLLLSLMVLVLHAAALGEAQLKKAADGQAIYEAYTNVRFNIRAEPQSSGKRVKAVERGEKVSVYELGGEWSMIAYDGEKGYCKTEWLFKFRSIAPYVAAVPGTIVQAGIARVVTPVHAFVPGYKGNLLKENDVLCVLDLNKTTATLSMMRDTVQIPASHLAFTPFVPWDKAQKGDVIGGFTTYYNEHTGGKKYAANRQYNISLAASRVHGTLVKAGEEFSYNRLCAPSTRANGYKLAPNISRDGVGYGGGICQLSTTLYNAVLGLPLQVTDWAVHRERGVPYIKMGFDAAVGSYSDFAFVNTLPYGICIEALPQNGVLTVLIRKNNG